MDLKIYGEKFLAQIKTTASIRTEHYLVPTPY
jgi:hypothetical protein